MPSKSKSKKKTPRTEDVPGRFAVCEFIEQEGWKREAVAEHKRIEVNLKKGTLVLGVSKDGKYLYLDVDGRKKTLGIRVRLDRGIEISIAKAHPL